MSFLHLSLLAGVAAITVPVMLHLFGQKQPQLIDFPALRFVRQTTQEQSSSWRLRHILLLLLRILLFAVLAFALSRPRVHSAAMGSIIGMSLLSLLAIVASVAAAVALVTRRPATVWATAALIALALWSSTALWGYRSLVRGPAVPSVDSSAPVAAAIIVDNGPTMSYLSAGSSRLNAAQEMTQWVLEQLPSDSRVGLLSGSPIGTLALDPASAKTQVQLVEMRGGHIDIPARIRTAYDLVLASELERKEVYVITDLSSVSWSTAQSDLQELLAEHSEDVLLQIIDLGSEDEANWRLGDAIPDFRSVPVGGDVEFDIEVTKPPGSSGGSVTVELLREEIDPGLPSIRDGELQTPASQVVDRRVVEFASGSTAQVKLSAQGLEQGTNNFRIRLDKPDPLAVDNVRFVSIPAYPQQPSLVVASDPELAVLLTLLIDPSGERGAIDSLADQVQYVQFQDAILDKYAVICLYDPPPMSAAAVQKLLDHVRDGGGLLIVLGPQLATRPLDPNEPLRSLLPGNLGTVATRDPESTLAFLDPVAVSHPAFGELGQAVSDINWNLMPVYRNWTFPTPAPDAQVLMAMSDAMGPAMLAQPLGRGQIITFTTPIPEPDKGRRELWNLLWASGDDSIHTFGLLLGTFRALSGADQQGATVAVGSNIALSNDPRQWPSRYTMYSPTGRARRIDANDGILSLDNLDQAGIYYLRGQRGRPMVRALSVNTPSEDTRLNRMELADLDSLLGSGNFRVAQNREQVESSVGQARFGRELYPLLMIFVAGLFLAEQAMSNRFYKVKLHRARKS